MPAHALLSLRARKYGDDWDHVWDFLADRHGFPGPLGLDEAVDQIVEKLKDKQGIAPGQVAPTVYELIGDSDRIGLRQDHLARLAKIVEPDDERRYKLLEHATETLNWDTSAMSDWGDVPASSSEEMSEESLTELPSPSLLEDAVPVSLHEWTSLLSEAALLKAKPIADAPTCTSKNVPGGIDGATTVYGQFEIEAKLSELEYATNPRNWPVCSWFFISMKEETTPTSLLPPDDVGKTSYTCDLEELVGLEDVLTVRTSLNTRYFVGSDSVGMEFDLTLGVHGDGKIDVDNGFLLAEEHPDKLGTLIVTSQKTFSFVGLDDLPFSFLCEFGWIDMMRAMAECREAP